MSERHREALGHLLYGLNGGGGFVLLTGEIGAGKTTVCRLFLEQIPARCNVAYLFNPKQTVIELLQSICDEFGIAVQRRVEETATVKDFIDPLNRYLLATHAVKQNNVLIIDEAQNLSADVLEQLRLLTNLETNERKLLQIILIGQPELRTMLERPELEQLAQRVIARFHLDALSPAETTQYIAHRLAVAGSKQAAPFSARVIRRIHRRTRGIPRRINLLCDRALLGAYAAGKHAVDARTVDAAALEVFGRALPGNVRWRSIGLGALAVILVLGGIFGDVDALLRSTKKQPVVGAASVQALAATPAAPAASTAPAISAPSMALAPAPVVVNERAPVVVGEAARDLPAAYRQLAQLWQADFSGDASCKALQAKSLYCFTGKGMNELRQLGRPAILTLRDDDDKPYYAVLTGVGASAVTLQIDGVSDTVNLDSLARRWDGEFSTLWRGPEQFRKLIMQGDRGPAVDWVAVRLARVDRSPPPSTDAVYDEPRIRRFQLAQGLSPDGVAGPQTLMRLATAAGSDEPRLDPRVIDPSPARK
ncbi:ExeA family protein [Actimicrobium antarcticum]|uniref:ExeA family protein n=1 Tax=Actimicrobium antarcticum TaxID=1051899 RepID=A0ABP7SKE8_9BURK